jgi:hypothetical protein
VTPATDIRRAINEKMDAIKNSLARGSAGDYTQYQHTIGMLDGLEMGKEIAIEVMKSRFQIEEDD